MGDSRDGARIRILGEWWDEWYQPDPVTGELKLLRKTKPRKNAQMDLSLVLVAALFKGEAGYGGILYHAQGAGDVGWGATPPTVNPAATQLYAEFDRRAPDSIVFLDGLDVPTVTPTAKLRISTTYGVGALAGQTIREQALFGGDATVTANSGKIINTIRHESIFKSGALVLTRRIKLTLTT